jgi:hypothetical protein
VLFNRVWRWYASPRRARFLRPVVEVWALSLQQPRRCQGVPGTGARDLVGLAADRLVAAGYAPAEGRARASLYVGALRGLLLDLLATGDRARLEAAVGLLGKTVERDLATLRTRRRPPARVIGHLRTACDDDDDEVTGSMAVTRTHEPPRGGT